MIGLLVQERISLNGRGEGGKSEKAYRPNASFIGEVNL